MSATNDMLNMTKILLLFETFVGLQVKRDRLGEALYSNKQGYSVIIEPSYDHSFLLCVVVILGTYYHQERGSGLYGAA